MGLLVGTASGSNPPPCRAGENTVSRGRGPPAFYPPGVKGGGGKRRGPGGRGKKNSRGGAGGGPKAAPGTRGSTLPQRA